MQRTSRLVLLAAGFTLVTASAGTLVTPAVAATAPSASIAVHGHLVTVASEVPGSRPLYGVALADGDIVPVRGRFAAADRTGDVFDGRLAIPASVTGSLAARRTPPTDANRAALRLVDRRSLTLDVSGTPTITPTITPVAPTLTPTSHQQFVAAIDNKGSLGQNDATLLGHVSTVGGYWEGESGGAISSIGVPATVTHYNTAVSTTDCGLGSDFFNVVQEAESKFPETDFFAGSDQLVLFVPSACVSGGIVGEGTVGSGFASGGALIVKAGSAINGTYAHEIGHNYGFNHANVRFGSTSMEYFGVYDVMGFAMSGFNQLTALSTPYRVARGITDPGEIQDVPLGDRSVPVHASVTIKPRSDDTGVRSVRVVDPDTGELLYLDYSGRARGRTPDRSTPPPATT